MSNIPSHLPPLTLNRNAEIVLGKRYFRKDDDGLPLEDGRALFWRVASSIAAQEAAYAASPWNVDSLSLAFYQMMTDWRFLPNSPTLMNAGLAARSAVGLFCPACGRLHRGNL